MKIVMPTESYRLSIPDEAVEDVDDRVASYWIPDSDVLFQISSYRRERGDQVPASTRMEERIAREALSDLRDEELVIGDCPDSASASGIDKDSCKWLFCYGVWPNLTIFASISAPIAEFDRGAKWAIDSLRSMQRCIRSD